MHGVAPLVQKEVRRNKKTSERLEITGDSYDTLAGKLCRVKVKRMRDVNQ